MKLLNSNPKQARFKYRKMLFFQNRNKEIFIPLKTEPLLPQTNNVADINSYNYHQASSKSTISLPLMAERLFAIISITNNISF
jgi:hypothetical protein